MAALATNAVNEDFNALEGGKLGRKLDDDLDNESEDIIENIREAPVHANAVVSVGEAAAMIEA